jgi:hypothetical protein
VKMFFEFLSADNPASSRDYRQCFLIITIPTLNARFLSYSTASRKQTKKDFEN